MDTHIDLTHLHDSTCFYSSLPNIISMIIIEGLISFVPVSSCLVLFSIPSLCFSSSYDAQPVSSYSSFLSPSLLSLRSHHAIAHGSTGFTSPTTRSSLTPYGSHLVLRSNTSSTLYSLDFANAKINSLHAISYSIEPTYFTSPPASLDSLLVTAVPPPPYRPMSAASLFG